VLLRQRPKHKRLKHNANAEADAEADAEAEAGTEAKLVMRTELMLRPGLRLRRKLKAYCDRRVYFGHIASVAKHPMGLC
jgi:hypothetical protein